MINADSKSTTAINFDSDWRYIRLSNTTTYDKDFISLSFNDHDWTSTPLPHYDDKKSQKFTSACVSYWYRKRFDFQQKLESSQQIYLHFESISNEKKRNKVDDESDVKIPAITIWLNGDEIFSNTLPEPVNLTKYLKTNSQNLLVIHSKQGYPLRLHARLLLPRRCSGQIDLNEFRSFHKKKGHERIIDYQAGFDDNDGLIAFFINAVQQHAKRNGLNAGHDANLDTNDDNEKEQLADIKPAATVEPRTIIEGPIPRLAILMLIVGTRGDVQPFIALSKALLACGHRVRLATHETFRTFVQENGIEFFPLAGDPADLMSFMVKNAGIVPSVSSIVAGDIAKSRRLMAEILASTWKACIDDDEEGNPFVAEAIIANPPSYGHVHCAQKLQIPLHIIFTMPWSPTIQFPHPLCKVDYNREPMEKINVLSYDLVEVLTWSGMRNIINEFRKVTLGLTALHTRQALHLMMDAYVPHTYCWSPSLVPKPADWPSHIDVSGFFFLDLASNYKPPDDISHFLKSGDPPIYIGFGSITGHDSKRLLQVVFEALETTGYRALISGFEVDNDKLSDKVLKIGNCPHDWLFQHVAAVCHHGGAGTTAAGLRAGKPTIIVPFFGDQFFWGSMISKSGAGPPPIPGKTITAKQLAAAFEFVHEPNTQSAALKISANFQNEHGCDVAVQSFHAQLPLHKMRSDLEPSFCACFRLNKYDLQISRPVAQVLVAGGAIKQDDLSPHPLHNWHTLIEGDGLKAITRGFRRAVSKITSSVNRLKRSRSLSNIDRNTQSNTRHEPVDIGRPFKDSIHFYGEVKEKPDDENNENSTSEKKTVRTVHYGPGTRTGKYPNNTDRNSTAAAGSSPAVPSPHKNIAKSKPDYTTVRGASNKNDQSKSKKPTQRSFLSKDKSLYTNDKNNNKPSAQKAADMSGLSIDVCKQILSDFKKIKEDPNGLNESGKSTFRILHPLGLRRSRSRTTADQ